MTDMQTKAEISDHETGKTEKVNFIPDFWIPGFWCLLRPSSKMGFCFFPPDSLRHPLSAAPPVAWPFHCRRLSFLLFYLHWVPVCRYKQGFTICNKLVGSCYLWLHSCKHLQLLNPTLGSVTGECTQSCYLPLWSVSEMPAACPII